jgi:hypothetical protein
MGVEHRCADEFTSLMIKSVATSVLSRRAAIAPSASPIVAAIATVAPIPTALSSAIAGTILIQDPPAASNTRPHGYSAIAEMSTSS